MSNVILSQIAEKIQDEDFISAQRLLPILKSLFTEQLEVKNKIDELESLLLEEDKTSEAALTDLKNILVG